MSANPAYQLEQLHSDINHCMQDLSESLVRSSGVEQDKLKTRFLQLVDEHFKYETELIQKLPSQEKADHLKSHQELWAKTRGIVGKERFEIDDYFELQYSFAKHEFEFDAELLSKVSS